MSKKGGGALLQEDVPWRASTAGTRPIPKIHLSPLLTLPQTPLSDYGLSIMKHPNPIGSGLGKEAIVEAAGPECIVPGQTVPVKLLGLKVWPVDVNLNFLEPIGKQLKAIGKIMDASFDAMDKLDN